MNRLPLKGKWRVLAPVLLALSITACNDEGYLFLQKPVPSKKVDVSHKLKQLQGNSVVDIIWVIDNSGSMAAHQRNVIANTSLFLSQFVRNGNILDWKMGLVSTDKADSPYIGFAPGQEVTSTTPNNVSLFQSAVGRLGTEGSYEEEGFEPLLSALRTYPSFVRPKSTLAMIFVTDAQEQGRQSIASIVSDLSKYKDTKDTVSYGIFWTRDLGCGRNPGEDEWELQGSRYGNLLKATSGKAWSLCSADFGKNLAELGKDLVSRVTSPRLFLDSLPRVSTLRVLHRGREVRAGLPGTGGYWYFDQALNAIIFHDLSFAPGDDEEVEVIYDEDNGVD